MSPFPPEIANVERSRRTLRPLFKAKLVALLIVAALSSSVGWIEPSPLEYGLLFGGLTDPEARRIAEELGSRAIQFQLCHDDHGGRIYVPCERARKLRLEICRSITGAAPWDLVDIACPTPGAAADVDPLEVRRLATEEELARTLEAMPAVSFARVSLTAHAGEGAEAEATVLIVVHDRFRFSSECRTLVQRLLVQSWPGLEASRVRLFAPGDSDSHDNRVV